MRLGYVIAYVADVAATVRFYETAFGLQARFVHESGAYAELETGQTALAFAAESMAEANGVQVAFLGRDRVAPALELALVTEDVAGAVQQAVAVGAELVAEPVQKPWGQTVAYVRDCNGLLVELCSPIG